MSPATARKIHLGLCIFWAVNMGAVWLLPATWRIPYLVVVSIYANMVGHWSGYSAERPTEILEEGKDGASEVDN